MAIVDPPMVHKLMLVPENNVFIGAQPGSALVIHKTASGTSAEQIANFFISDPGKKSAHFVIGQDGEIVQCVHLVDGAGANCCVETGYDPYWNPLIQKFGNLNRCTISIEHCDPASDNSTPLTSAQKASSFTLVKWLVDQYGFDIKHDIKGHNSIDPIDRARCPGNYPWDELFAYLENGGETMITLTTPGVSNHFAAVPGNSTQWRCIQTGKIIQYAILAAYQKYGNSASCGLTFLGLPLSNEITIDPVKYPHVVKQFFERGCVVYDPSHLIDNPPGSGSVYATHLYDGGVGTDPAIMTLEAEITQLKQSQGNPQDHALLLQVKQLVALIS